MVFSAFQLLIIFLPKDKIFPNLPGDKPERKIELGVGHIVKRVMFTEKNTNVYNALKGHDCDFLVKTTEPCLSKTFPGFTTLRLTPVGERHDPQWEDDKEVYRYAFCVLSALHCLHERGIVHRFVFILFINTVQTSFLFPETLELPMY